MVGRDVDVLGGQARQFDSLLALSCQQGPIMRLLARSNALDFVNSDSRVTAISKVFEGRTSGRVVVIDLGDASIVKETPTGVLFHHGRLLTFNSSGRVPLPCR